MFDEKMLDGLSVSQLSRALVFVQSQIEGLEAELPEGEDDPRIDKLYELGNRIIRRMDVLIREDMRNDPRALDQWAEAMRGYEVDYDKYSDAILSDDTLLDIDPPEST